MNPLDCLIIKILKLDTKKIDNWMKDKNVHTRENYKKVNQEWIESSNNVKKQLRYLELHEKNPEEYLKKLVIPLRGLLLNITEDWHFSLTETGVEYLTISRSVEDIRSGTNESKIKRFFDEDWFFEEDLDI